jgi:hypothetical protein
MRHDRNGVVAETLVRSLSCCARTKGWKGYLVRVNRPATPWASFVTMSSFHEGPIAATLVVVNTSFQTFPPCSRSPTTSSMLLRPDPEARNSSAPKGASFKNRVVRTLITFAAMLVITMAGPNVAGAEDVGAHMAALRKRFPAFTVVEQPPFVVLGDEPADVVQLRASRIVKWAVDVLKRDFFANDPEEIIDVWLFADKASYEKHTLETFGEKPTTPYATTRIGIAP